MIGPVIIMVLVSLPEIFVWGTQYRENDTDNSSAFYITVYRLQGPNQGLLVNRKS